MKKPGIGKPVVVGLTGGLGVGKSEVARILEAKGAAVISADKIGHEILADNRAVRKKLVGWLGEDIITEDSRLDRRKIGAMVFGDPMTMSRFNSIVHPPLLSELKKAIGRENSRKVPLVVVDAALIFEWGIADWFNLILVVQARRAIRLSRMAGQGLSKSQAIKRIASQMPQRDKVALADSVIENNSTRRALKKETLKFYNLIREVCQGKF